MRQLISLLAQEYRLLANFTLNASSFMILKILDHIYFNIYNCVVIFNNHKPKNNQAPMYAKQASKTCNYYPTSFFLC